MTTARELSRRFGAASRRRMALATVAALAAGFGITFAYGWGYSRVVQHPACYAYARDRGMGDARSLRVTEVRISYGFTGGHRCSFVGRRTGQPVSLEFAPRDVPRVRDFVEWMSMVVLMVLVMGAILTRRAGSVVDSRYERSAEAALRRRRRG